MDPFSRMYVVQLPLPTNSQTKKVRFYGWCDPESRCLPKTLNNSCDSREWLIPSISFVFLSAPLQHHQHLLINNNSDPMALTYTHKMIFYVVLRQMRQKNSIRQSLPTYPLKLEHVTNCFHSRKLSHTVSTYSTVDRWMMERDWGEASKSAQIEF